jgi:hypothetical protein
LATAANVLVDGPQIRRVIRRISDLRYERSPPATYPDSREPGALIGVEDSGELR